jgi:pSer/pThr/pTyr-binding forkhead associated (FHA) protein
MRAPSTRQRGPEDSRQAVKLDEAPNREGDHQLVDSYGNIILPFGRWTIGRSACCDVVIRNITVSREHAVLARAAGMLQVKDCRSKNGIIVNGRKVNSAPLVPGDLVAFGSVELAVHDDSRLVAIDPNHSTDTQELVPMASDNEPVRLEAFGASSNSTSRCKGLFPLTYK